MNGVCRFVLHTPPRHHKYSSTDFPTKQNHLDLSSSQIIVNTFIFSVISVLLRWGSLLLPASRRKAIRLPRYSTALSVRPKRPPIHLLPNTLTILQAKAKSPNKQSPMPKASQYSVLFAAGCGLPAQAARESWSRAFQTVPGHLPPHSPSAQVASE